MVKIDIILGMSATFIALIFSIYKGVFVGLPLILGFSIFSFISFKRGYSLKSILQMSYRGGKKAFVVLQIFLLIGVITSVWMSSGTVPAIVFYGIRFMNPNFFILSAFLISSFISFLLGTSLGTVSTVGIALIAMARGGNVDLNIVTGAILSGAYFGDRCSPMSSSANLVASLTGTDLFINIKNMLRSSIIPFLITMLLYTYFSIKEPLIFTGNDISKQISETFTINLLVLLPAIIILVLSIFKINVKVSMLLSIFIACLISIFLQKYSLGQVFRYLLSGFYLEDTHPLYQIIKGGGLFSMVKAALVVFISCALAGIFEDTSMLESIEDLFAKSQTHTDIFFYTSLVSLATAAIGCSQAISVVLTNQLMSNTYQDKKIDRYKLALDLENTGIVLSALIPWNMAAFVPTTTMNVSKIGYLPYAFYLYLIPLSSILFIYLKESKKSLSN